MDKVRVEKISSADEKIFLAVQNLLAQLYPKEPPLDFDKFERVVQDSNIRVYVALYGETIVGTAQLASYEKLGGEVWVIEDVVVDESLRGKGVGQKLTNAMLRDARAAGARCVDLSTRRPEARKFYIEKCGFRDKADGRPFWGLRYTF